MFKLTRFRVTTPLRVMLFTVTEWIDHGETLAKEDVAIARLVDPSIPNTFRLEVL